MKKLELIGLNQDRDRLLSELMRLSCAQIEEQNGLLSDADAAGLLSRAAADTADIRTALNTLKQALDTLIKHAHPKRGMFEPRPVMSEKELLDGGALREASAVSDAIMASQRGIAELNTEEGRLQNRRAALGPWRGLLAPLSVGPAENCFIGLGVCPAMSDMEELKKLLFVNAPLSELYVISSDREQHYLMFFCHNSQWHEAYALLKSYSFSAMRFKDVDTTASEACDECDARIEEIGRERAALEREICSHAGDRDKLEHAIDALGVCLSRAEAAERALSTRLCFRVAAWVEAPRVSDVERVLGRCACAWEFSEPDADGERPPIKLKNSKLLEPFNMVTDMYSPPDYFNVDPNPLFSFFFALFFGIMYADLGYGLVLVALGLFVTFKVKARGMIGQMFRLMIIVGASSAVMGLVFGGFFSDALNVAGKTFFNTDSWGIRPLWFDPMQDPLKVLIACLAVGGVQVLFGMGIKAYILIRDGKPLDALMDVGSWWLLFAGIAVAALGGGMWVAIAGAAALVLTQGRGAKNIFGKIAGGLGSLYDITAYLSDVLSYCRLMALCMAGAVIGSVFNMLAGMVAGGFIIGPLLFAVVFLVGHSFNMAINIIGTYVHAARLQYLEFFGKFYEGGGKAFRPLAVSTKYVDIVKEEN
ncbi:MAG: V-type ATP synthase subunit I [Oscillospiraceae bacterium]|nr:V-type ATP synthase subunit I [Oscillospiraceae bacterium]